MDPGYTPYDDLPGRLREAIQLLQHYKNTVSMQARRVVDVAVTEWLKADERVAASAAVISQEEQWAEDRGTCIAAIRKRKAERPNERAVDWETLVAGDTDHAGRLEPTTEGKDWKKVVRKPPSAITGYTGVSRANKLYRVLCDKTDLGRYTTAEEAAERRQQKSTIGSPSSGT